MKEKQEDLLYLSLHHQLKRNVGINGIMERKKLFTILGKHYLVPKNLRCVVIKEMETRGLIKCETKSSIVVLNCEHNFENNVNGFYEGVGLIEA